MSTLRDGLEKLSSEKEEPKKGIMDRLAEKGSRRKAALVGSIAAPAAGLGAQKGKRLRTSVGATAGSVAGLVGGSAAGGSLGRHLGGDLGGSAGSAIAGNVGAIGGGALGAYLGHGKDNPNPKGNDKDGDGKTDEPKPFKKKASSLDKRRKAFGEAVGTGVGAAAGGALGSFGTGNLVNALPDSVRTHPVTGDIAGALPLAGALSGAVAGKRLGGKGMVAFGRYGDRNEAKVKARKEKRLAEKKGSVLEYARLFDHIAAGEMGKEAQVALRTVSTSVDSQLDIMEKTAYKSPSSSGDGGPGIASNDDAEVSRKRRLAELLRKREHSGTATGSASPNPSKGC